MNIIYKLLLSFFLLFPLAITAQNVNVTTPSMVWGKKIHDSKIKDSQLLELGSSSDNGYNDRENVILRDEHIFMLITDSIVLTHPDTILYRSPHILSLLKFDVNGTKIWQKQIIKSRGMGGKLHMDSEGNFFVQLELFPNDTLTILDNNNVHISGDDFQEVFIKFDQNGEHQWTKHLNNIFYSSMKIDVNDHLLVYGKISEGSDIDPSEAELLIQKEGFWNPSFIARYDNDMNLLWAEGIFIESGLISNNRLHTDRNGNIYISEIVMQDKVIYNDVDYDVDGLFILKIDQDGHKKWLKNLQIIGAEEHRIFLESEIQTDLTEEVFIVLSFSGISNDDPIRMDVDPGLAELIKTPASAILHLDKDGNFKNYTNLFSQQISQDTTDSFIINSLLTNEKLYITIAFIDLIGSDIDGVLVEKEGYYLGLMAMDLNLKLSSFYLLDTANEELVDSYETFDYHISNDGAFLYQVGTYLNRQQIEFGNSFLTDPSDDPNYKIFAAKYALGGCTDIRIDIKDLHPISCENNIGSATAQVIGGASPFEYSWQTTPVQNTAQASFSTEGFYDLVVKDDNDCELKRSIYVDKYKSQTGYDLNVHVNAGNFRSGLEADILLYTKNDACVAQDGKIELILDSDLTFISASPAPSQIEGNKLIWDNENMRYNENDFIAMIKTEVFPQKPAGEKVCIIARATPFAGDNNPQNNEKEYCYTVFNSYDPNDKQVFPNGQCDEGFILKDQELTYTIRFQNTGNAPAININIIDTLPLQLELDSFKLQATSHLENLVIDKTGNNTVVFKFSNIMLPDSASYPEESQGYVTFAIYPKTTVAQGTVLRNRAGIYFDFNEPIITNYTVNTITDVMILNDVKAVITPQGILASGGDRYQWYRCTAEGGKEKLEGITGNIYQPASSGLYAAEVSYGTCTKMTDCIEFVTTGIGSKESLQMTIYPNPSKGNFTMQLNQAIGDATLSIYHTNGQKILSRQLNNIQQYSLDMTAPSGMYLLQLTESDGREFRQPIQIIR